MCGTRWIISVKHITCFQFSECPAWKKKGFVCTRDKKSYDLMKLAEGMVEPIKHHINQLLCKASWSHPMIPFACYENSL